MEYTLSKDFAKSRPWSHQPATPGRPSPTEHWNLATGPWAIFHAAYNIGVINIPKLKNDSISKSLGLSQELLNK